MTDRPPALDGQGVHHGVLEGPGDVRQGLGVVPLLAQRIEGVCLQTAEAEIQARTVGHGAREVKPPRVAPLRQLRQPGPARVAQPQELGGLVEGLPRRIVSGLPEDLVITDTSDPDQHGMPSRHQQGQEGKLGGPGLEQGGQQVTLHMMDADGRHVQRPRQAAAESRPDQQRPDQPRPRGVGDTVDLVEPGTRLGQGAADQGNQVPDVIPGGKLGHHSPVFGMERRLGAQGMGEQPAVGVVQGDSRLIAGGLDAEHFHDPRAHLISRF